ncbi:MAG TPA: protein kinase, partial [bacterium]|nr:protein kinase [bacterium]
MTRPEQWPRIQVLLDELLDLSPTDGRRRLDALTGGDAALRPELERLLAADAASQAGPLDAGLGPLAEAVVDPDGTGTPAAGQRIGAYRVLRELGRGGMGEVLLAERAEGDFEQRVAIKIVRAGMNRAEIVERFRRERNILARLRHPNIASLHDGGTTGDGLPYFAMEYVDGERITDWCDARRLDVDARVDLFRSVCAA